MQYNLITNLEFDYDKSDYPDFCDASIIAGEINGVPLTADELEEVNGDMNFVHDSLVNYLY